MDHSKFNKNNPHLKSFFKQLTQSLTEHNGGDNNTVNQEKSTIETNIELSENQTNSTVVMENQTKMEKENANAVDLESVSLSTSGSTSLNLS
jgi:hypothetical protein